MGLLVAPVETGRGMVCVVMVSHLIRRDVISLARLVGCPVLTWAGEKAGRVADVAGRVADGDAYPVVTGIVVRASRRRAFHRAATMDRASSRAVIPH